MTKKLWIVPLVLLTVCRSATASVINFDTPDINSLMTHTYNAIQGPLLYSDSHGEFDLGDVMLTADGATSGGFASTFYFRNTFDNRTPYPYQSISNNVVQIASNELWLDFDGLISTFAFGAALNSTNRLSTMSVEWFLGGTLVGNGILELRSSPSGGNSEGTFSIGGIEADKMRLTNVGDGLLSASRYNWVIDNITYDAVPVPVPEPPSLVLASTAIVGVFIRGWRRRRSTRPATVNAGPNSDRSAG